MTIEEIARSEGIWSSQPQESPDIVLKSSVQFFRNIEGNKFAHKLSKREKERVNRLLVDCVKVNEIFPDVYISNVDDLFPTDRKILHERNILKDECSSGCTLVMDHRQSSYFILGEADHLRFVVEKSGFRFDELYTLSKSVLGSIEKKLEFSFSPRFGYLAANPRNAGVALLTICYMHLPGLVLSGSINDAASELDNKGFGVRSSWIEGYYEIYNKGSMMPYEPRPSQEPPDTLKDSLEDVEKGFFDGAVSSFRAVIDLEREIRDTEYRKNRGLIEDRVWRSYGTLTSSRLLSLYESLELLSSLRLGVSLGILNGLAIKDINLLLTFVQDYHLRRRYNVSDTQLSVDDVRAQFVRDYLKEAM